MAKAVSKQAKKIGAALKYALAYVEKDAAKTVASRSAEDIEDSWRVWLRAIAPKTFTAEFTSFHAEFMEWYWALLSLRAAGEEVPENFPRAGLLALGRGLGKSTLLEAIALAEGAMIRDSFGVYISSTQAKAKEHLASIRDLIESSEIAKYYPGLANPRVGKFGNQRGWNAEAIYTDSDFAIVAVSLEKGIRGLRDEERRPSFICHQWDTLICDEGRWSKVQDHYSAELTRVEKGITVAIRGVPNPETVTNEHRYWARRMFRVTGKGNETSCGLYPLQWSDDGWMEAQDLDINCFIGLPIDMTVEQPRDIFTYKRLAEQDASTGRLTGGKVEDGSYQPREFADPDWWWLFGFWLGNGCTNQTQVCLTIANHTAEVFERVKSILARYDKPYSIRPEEGCFTLIFTHTAFARWLNSWYLTKEKKAQKCPPYWVEWLPLEYQRELIKGYIASDGFVDRKGMCVRITSVSLDALRSVRRILARIGIPSSIRAGIGEGFVEFKGKTYATQPKYDIRFRENIQQLGIDIEPQSRYQVTRNFIDAGYLWSKVKSVTESGETCFVPIQTKSRAYTTDFGLSHNCFDDIDERDDSPVIKQEKFDTIRFDALPMLAPFGIAIYAQNLIYSGSVMDDTLKRKLDWFALRHQVGPVNTFQDDLEIEKIDGRPTIVAGTPNWSRIGKSEGQALLDLIGEEAIYRECQNKTTPPAEKMVWTGFNEQLHVISWAQFSRVFGSNRIPSPWFLYAGYDAGTTGPERHPAVFSVAAVSAENSPQPEDVFLIYEYVADAGVGEDEMAKALITDLGTLCHDQGIQEAAKLVRDSYREDISERYAWEMRYKAGSMIPFQVFRGSHEAASERKTLRSKWGLPVIAGKAGKTEGLSQLRFYLKPEAKPHPFKPGLQGRPNLYLVVADDQLDAARDRFGLQRHRWEASNLKWDPKITTRDVPTKFGDDATDACFVAGALIETEFGSLPIERVNIGDRVWTREGLRQVVCAGMTNANALVYKLTSEQGASVIGTANHPIRISREGVGMWMPLGQCSKGDKITVWKQLLFTAKEKQRSLCSMGSSITAIRKLLLTLIGAIFRRTLKTVGEDIPRSMSRFGSTQTIAKYRMGMRSTTETVTRWITSRIIWNACITKNIVKNTWRRNALAAISAVRTWIRSGSWPLIGIAHLRAESGTENTQSATNSAQNSSSVFALAAVWNFIPPVRARSTVQDYAGRVISSALRLSIRFVSALNAAWNTKERWTVGATAAAVPIAFWPGEDRKRSGPVLFVEPDSRRGEKIAQIGVREDAVLSVEPAGRAPVYNLTVADTPEYFANGILVHNCKQFLQTFAMTAAPLTERERRNLEMPENLREENAPSLGDGWARDGWELARMVEMDKAKRRKRASGEDSNWSHEVIDPHDDPWAPQSPFADTEDDPWKDWNG